MVLLSRHCLHLVAGMRGGSLSVDSYSFSRFLGVLVLLVVGG
jgi:hypothetical protein